jgi:hypothetical protein
MPILVRSDIRAGIDSSLKGYPRIKIIILPGFSICPG